MKIQITLTKHDFILLCDIRHKTLCCSIHKSCGKFLLKKERKLLICSAIITRLCLAGILVTLLGKRGCAWKIYKCYVMISHFIHEWEESLVVSCIYEVANLFDCNFQISCKWLLFPTTFLRISPLKIKMIWKHFFCCCLLHEEFPSRTFLCYSIRMLCQFRLRTELGIYITNEWRKKNY